VSNIPQIPAVLLTSAVVCGSWAAHHEIPAGSSSTMALTAQQDDIYITVRNILEGPYPHEG
jgi:endothelin-converting enzyme